MWKKSNQVRKICNRKIRAKRLSLNKSAASLWHIIMWRFIIIYVEFQKVIIFTPKCRTIRHIDIVRGSPKDLNSSILLPYAFCLFSFVLSFFALSIALLKHSRLLSSLCPMRYALCPLPHALCPLRALSWYTIVNSQSKIVNRSCPASPWHSQRFIHY